MPTYAYGDVVLVKGLSDDFEMYNGYTAEVQYCHGDGEYEITLLNSVTITIHEDFLEPLPI